MKYVFSTIFSNISLLELRQTQNQSPSQTTRHLTVRQEIYLFSQSFLDTIRESFTSIEISQNVKYDLQRILAWFIVD